MGALRPRICDCCKEAKKCGDYSCNPAMPDGLTTTCRECGLWLRLLAAEFGETREWDANRKKKELRSRIARAARRAEGATNLCNVWGIQKPKDYLEPQSKPDAEDSSIY